MKLSFRSKLLVLVGTAAIALLALLLSSAIIASQVEGHLDDIRRRYLPKVGLRPQLEGQFERIQRAFQDAVAASDADKLSSTIELKNQFLRELSESSGAVDPALAAALRQAIEDFHAAAMSISTRLIARESGEGVVTSMGEMQAKQTRVAELLDQATVFDKTELTNAFSAAAEAQRIGGRVRLGLSLAALALVLLLSLWISRDMLRGMAHLTAGFARFGAGDFASAIPVVSRDELGVLATRANHMAASLQRLESERGRVDWLKSGQSALWEQLRGELEPAEVADRAITVLCHYLDCPVGAVYVAHPDGDFHLLGKHALSAGQVTARIRRGEGLGGQAALQSQILVVPAPPDQLRISSGLAEGSPRSIVLAPLLRAGKVTGLVELASLHPWKDASTELLAAVRETLAIKIDAARGQAELREVLAETRRQAEEVESQRASLEEKNAALLDARQRLEQKAEELTRAGAYKSQFLANMSHELRTPLNAIIGFTQLLHEGEAGPITSEQRDFLGNVLTSSRHLLRLINDVLDLAKVESGKLDFRPETIELRSLIGEVVAILRTAAAERNVQVEVAVDQAIWTAVLDPARLKQVLYNYLSNALKFTPVRGKVTVRALPEGTDFFRLEVHDTGGGIAPADLQRLFVEFQQLDAGAAKKHGGTGLGLALTKRIVEAQGGSVGVRSSPQEGTVFHAVLPRKAKGDGAAIAKAIVSRNPGGPEILVIEDNAADCTVISEALIAAGYSVETAATGAQALARFRERSFDAITLDLLLPDMSGVELLAQIRAERRNADVPVIVLTVVAEEGAVAGFAVSDVLAKPVDTAALLGALARAGVARDQRGAVLVVDDDLGSLRLMEVTLGRCGYDTICRRDAEAALQAAVESRPVAVVLDLVMPRVDGFEFLERFRQMDVGRRTPVIIWTVKDLSAREQDRLRATAHAIVFKGKDGADALVRELRAFLPQPQGTN